MTNSQADRKIKKLLDDMARNGSTLYQHRGFDENHRRHH